MQSRWRGGARGTSTPSPAAHCPAPPNPQPPLSWGRLTHWLWGSRIPVSGLLDIQLSQNRRKFCGTFPVLSDSICGTHVERERRHSTTFAPDISPRIFLFLPGGACFSSPGDSRGSLSADTAQIGVEGILPQGRRRTLYPAKRKCTGSRIGGGHTTETFHSLIL